MRIARVHVSPEFLRDALHLPAGTEILWAGMPLPHADSIIEVTLTHPDLREVELVGGERPPLIRPRFHREAECVLLEDWGQTS